MTTMHVHPATYLGAETSIRSWAFTTDHKRIGILYLVTLLFMLALGGFFAMVMRLEHLSPTGLENLVAIIAFDNRTGFLAQALDEVEIGVAVDGLLAQEHAALAARR